MVLFPTSWHMFRSVNSTERRPVVEVVTDINVSLGREREAPHIKGFWF